MTTTTLTVQPFTVSVSDAEIADLDDRLARTRLPQPSPTDDWDAGTPNDYLREAVDAWRSFDWAAAESRINAVPHFTTEIDGQIIISSMSVPPSRTPPHSCWRTPIPARASTIST